MRRTTVHTLEFAAVQLPEMQNLFVVVLHDEAQGDLAHVRFCSCLLGRRTYKHADANCETLLAD
jgi:hypothetical protein